MMLNLLQNHHSNMIKKTCLIVLLLTSSTLFSQPPELKLKDIRDASSLSSHSIRTMAQDCTGYIWIGTINGLNRYDGYKIKPYRKIPGDSTSLIHNRIRCLYTDQTGQLWIGTQEGLAKYKAAYDHFTRIVEGEVTKGMLGSSISDIQEDTKGNLLVAEGPSIYKYLPAKDTFHREVSTKGKTITRFIVDQNNHIWLGTEQEGGLYQFNQQRKLVKHYLKDEDSDNTLSHNTIYDLVMKDNHLWIATFGGGVNVYDTKENDFQYYQTSGTFSKYIKKIYIDNKNRVWICDLTGLKVFNKETNSFYGYYPSKDNKHSVKGNAEGIMQDRQDNYWVYYSDKGVAVTIRNKGFHQFDSNANNYWPTSNDHISTICEDRNNNLWLGTPYDGIDVFQWDQGKILRHNYREEDPYSLGKGSVFELYRDSRNIMWIGTHMGGLEYYEPKDDHFHAYKHNPDNPSSIAKNDVRAIDEDEKGNLWLAVHGKGVDYFNRKTESFRHYNNKNSGLSNDWVFDVLYTREKELWVASAWGLSLLEKGKNQFKIYTYNENDLSSISNNEVICLFEDSRGIIWAGTADGLNKYNPETDNFTRYQKGFNNTNICSIEEDRQNRLWISTLGGLTRFNPKTEEFFNFDVNDGLQSEEFSPRSSYKNDKNELFFGGIGGVNVFKPSDLKYNQDPPNVVISGFKLFYNEITEYGENSVLKKHISHAEQITLDYDQNIITFEFVALNFIQSKKNEYAYMLEGFDQSWHYVGHKREATYTNLNPGEYTFRVKAANNDGVWNNEGDAVKLEVLPPWYLSSWFFIASGIFIILVLYTIYTVRTTSLKKQKRILELKVDARTKELKDKNDTLYQQTEELNDLNARLEERQQQVEEQSEHLKQANRELKHTNAEKDKMFSIIAHDLRSPFNGILGFSELMAKETDQYDKKELSELAKHIYNSATRVYGLLENLLQWAGSQTNHIQYKPRNIQISELIEENYKLVKEQANQKNIHIQLPEIANFTVYVDPEMMGTAFRNLLGNAVKFSPRGGKIEITVQQKRKYAQISIADHGTGISEENKKKLFSLNNKNSIQGTEGEKGSGLGLILSKEFIEKNQGKLWLEDNEPQGSVFSFTLPLARGNA